MLAGLPADSQCTRDQCSICSYFVFRQDSNAQENPVRWDVRSRGYETREISFLLTVKKKKSGGNPETHDLVPTKKMETKGYDDDNGSIGIVEQLSSLKIRDNNNGCNREVLMLGQRIGLHSFILYE